MSQQMEEGGIAIGIHEVEPGRMAVEVTTPHGSVYVSAEVAEALAIDMMECVGLLEAFEEGGVDALKVAISELDMTPANEESAELLGIPMPPQSQPELLDAREYSEADEFLADMEHKTNVQQAKKTLH